MIRLTRLNNQQIAVNSDLIKSVESKPDTVITLVTGEKMLVHESVEDVICRVIEFRRAIISGIVSSGDAKVEMLSSSTNAHQGILKSGNANEGSRG